MTLFDKMVLSFLPQKDLILILVIFTSQFLPSDLFIVFLKFKKQFCQNQHEFSTLANIGSGLYIFTHL